MRALIAAVAVLAVLACTSCLRTPYNRCTEMPPDRECESLDAGFDGRVVDASTADAIAADAIAVDAGAPDASAVDVGSDVGSDGG